MSSTVKKEYIKAKGENNYLKVELYYSLGGMNYFNYKNEQRGYYVSVCPVQRESRNCFTSESYTAFSGRKMLVEPCARRGKKAEENALSKYEEAKKTLLSLYAEQIDKEAESAA